MSGMLFPPGNPRVDNEWSGQFSTGQRSKYKWHEVEAVRFFLSPAEAYTSFRDYTPYVDLFNE
eukprot:6742026-Prorocentrum_lima.AAC.1